MTGLLIAGVALALLCGLAYTLWRRKRLQEAHQQLVVREGLVPTHTPCGLDKGVLSRLRACPEGDRRYGVEYGVEGPSEVTVGGERVAAEVAAFVWWWEERRTSTDSKGHTRTSYVRQDRIVGAVRLPVAVPAVSIAPEGLLTRWGVGGRGDFQVESEEFNRRFDVRAPTADPTLVIRLFDASFQRFLLEMFASRHIELIGDVLLVGGDPPGRDADLFGDVGELPGARRDAALVASRVPEGFWRGLAVGGERP